MSEDAVEMLNRVYLHSGWNRYLPEGAVAVLPLIVLEGASTDDALDAELRASAHTPAGLDSPAWEPLNEYTDESLAKLREDFGADPDELSAAEVMAQEAAARAEHIEEMGRYAAHLEVPPVRTLRDLLVFMEAANIIARTSNGWQLNPDAPLPEEVLPLTPEQRADEDQLRWSRVHEATVQRLIRLFRPHDFAPADRVRASLSDLASELDIPVESTREAVALLASDPDFSIDVDPETVDESTLFTISVDWEVFHATRMSISTATKPEEEN